MATQGGPNGQASTARARGFPNLPDDYGIRVEGGTNEAVASTYPEPIAVCGIGLRLPGGVRTGDSFWDVLRRGQNLRGPVPADRFDMDGFGDALSTKCAVKPRHGYFLDEDLGLLNTSFFNMSKAELEKTDPQQRKALEVALECLWNAGETNWRSRPIGVYVGTFGDDWLQSVFKESQFTGGYNFSGDLMIANRISYELDLQGPSLVVKTGCIASLVALHEACRALQGGDCSAALVCGTSLIMGPHTFSIMSSEGILSPEGSCKTFDAAADGFARAEGINAVFLKRVPDALRDGNPIRAVLRNSGNNSDGKSVQGLLSPSSSAQEALMRHVYSQAHLDPADTVFMECHGTGTPAGDPIETTAVGNIFGNKSIYIGSVKPNTGHSEGASGLTSPIKAVLALENKMIPPNIKFSKPNPKIPFTQKNLVVPVEPLPWPKDRAERVSVNSFGIGGSNAHAIVESTEQFFAAHPHMTYSSPLRRPSTAALPSTTPRLLLFSANTAESVQRFGQQCLEHVKQRPENAVDLAYTLACRREKLSRRSYALVSADGDVGDVVSPSKTPSRKQPLDVVFVFSGQGAQWPQMGRELLLTHPVFSRVVDELDGALRSLKNAPEWSLRDELLKPKHSSQVYQAELSQPLTTAVQLGLVRVLRGLGVTPKAVIGHSSGEIAAAHATGLLSIREAIVISYLRGVAAKSQTNEGGMAAVGLTADTVKRHLRKGVVIAAENSPTSVTISGDVKVLDEVLEEIKANHPDALARRLQVDMAYHCPQHMNMVGVEYMKAMEAELGANSRSLLPNTSETAMFSTVTTQTVTEPLTLDYWVANLNSPVKFGPSFSSMLASLDGQPFCVEIGPHSQLAGPIRQICAAERVPSIYAPTMIRSANCIESVLSALGQLFQQDVAFNPSADSTLFPPGKVLTDMPLYAWDHSVSYWHENRVSQDWRFRKYGHHALLGERVPECSNLEPTWRCVLDLEDEPWSKDHVVDTKIVFPFTGYVCIAGEAIRQVTGIEAGFAVKHVVVHTALVLAEGRPVELLTSFRRRKLTDTLDSEYYDFVISSFSGSIWTKHCEGSVKSLDQRISCEANAKTLSRKVSASRWYDIMDRVGLAYGQAFRGIEFLEASPTDYRAVAGIANTLKGPFLFHPATMDSAFQLVIAAGAKGAARNLTQLVVPTLIEEIEVFPAADRMIAEAWAVPGSKDVGLACTDGGRVVLRVKGARLTPLESDRGQETDRHMAARLEFSPSIDFMDISSLIKAPIVKRQTRVLTEEIVLLSILDSAARPQSLEPSQPHYRQYREWLFRERQRALDGAYPLAEIDALHFTTLDGEMRSKEIHKRLENISEDPTLDVLARSIHMVNQNCEDLFTSRMDALALLLEHNLLAEIYNSISFDFSNFVKTLCTEKPMLRILEVGAGTGGTTEMILRDLVGTSKNPLYSLYTFTDVSAGFSPQASERFKYAPNMEYKVFDISQSPFNQAFQPESYDLILANNVVHATPNLRSTLANLQPLLRPGGHLLLSEVCATAARAPSFVFGHFSGWWMGEADDRKWQPFVSVDRWDQELKAAGFTGVDTAVFDEDEPYQYCAAILSHPISHANNGRTAAPLLEAITVLCDKPDEGPSSELIEELRSRGHDVAARKFGSFPLPPDHPVFVTLDLEGPFFQDLTKDRLRAFQDLCRQHQDQKLLWLMPPVQIGCLDPRHAQTIGTLRIVREELSLPFYTLEMAQLEPAFTDLALKVLRKIVEHDDETLAPDAEFVVDEGVVKVGRCQPISLEQEMASAVVHDSVIRRLSIGKPGLLETLRWVGCGPNSLGTDEVEIETKAVGLNFRDIMVSMGILTFGDGTPQLGLELSGVVTRVGPGVQHIQAGDHVMAAAVDGCLSTKAVVQAALVVKIPDSLGFEDAATMPIVFATVIQALTNVGNLTEGKRVLIHSACGGIGHAAVQLCKNAGAEIYVTVGSDLKSEYAQRVLGIPKQRIFNSRDDSFVADVMRETGGKGVDIVLNSLSGKLLHASWKCVAEFGQLVELGKRDLVGFGSLELEPFLLNRSYCCVDLAHMLERRPGGVGRLLQGIVDLYCDGKIQPITTRIEYPAEEIEQAFRHIQKGDHIGKAIVTMPGNWTTSSALPKPTGLKFDPSASYLITGGLGGIGRPVATWMAERGARNLIFLSRSAGRGEHDHSFFAELEDLGCAAVAVPGNAQIMKDVERAIAQAPTAIKGVIHLAMVLRDGPVLDLSFEEWSGAIAPKVEGAWNLHNAFLGRTQSLDFFLVSSSIVALVHHPGQSNYAAANSFLEAFVQYRRRLGLPAAALGICPIDDVGFVADTPIARRKLRSQGLQFIPEREMLESVELVLKNQHNEKRPSTAEDPLAPWTNNGYTVIGLHSEVHLDDAKCSTVWRRNRKMGWYHNVRAASAATGGGQASSGLKAFLAEAAADNEPVQFLPGLRGFALLGNVRFSDTDRKYAMAGCYARTGWLIRHEPTAPSKTLTCPSDIMTPDHDSFQSLQLDL